MEEQSEDCLTCDVTIPVDAVSTSKLPVMVFLHGGALFLGSGSRPYYDPTRLLTQAGDTSAPFCHVSLNYRLGALGFFHSPSAGEGVIPANNGLHDQLAGFEWLKRNIGGFGGDVSRICAIGESAGALSLTTHNISGRQDGNVWSKCVTFSGTTVTMPAKTPEEHEENFRSYAEKLGIISKDDNGQTPSGKIAETMISSTPVDEIRDLAFVGAPCCETSDMMPYGHPEMKHLIDRPVSKNLNSQIVSWCTYDGGISYHGILEKRKGHAKLFAKIARSKLKHADDLLALYEIDADQSNPSEDDDAIALQRICQFETDIGFFAPALASVRGNAGKSRMLMFDLPNPFGDAGPLPGMKYATHAWDVVSLLGAYDDRLSGDYQEAIRAFRRYLIDHLVDSDNASKWPLWTEEDGYALRVSLSKDGGVRIVTKDEYMGEGTRMGKLLALASREASSKGGVFQGCDTLWQGVCRPFLMHE